MLEEANHALLKEISNTEIRYQTEIECLLREIQAISLLPKAREASAFKLAAEQLSQIGSTVSKLLETKFAR